MKRREFGIGDAVLTACVAIMTYWTGSQSRRVIEAQSAGMAGMMRAMAGPPAPPPAPPAAGSERWLLDMEHELGIAGHEIDCPVCIEQAAEDARLINKYGGPRIVAAFNKLRGNDATD